MKNLLMILCMVGMLSTTSMVFAFQNEPDGFRGIKWGTNLNNLSDMHPVVSHGNLKTCTRKGDKMQIGDAELTHVSYMFYKDRFCGVWIKFKSSFNFDIIKETLFSVYGKGRQDNPFKEEYEWIGEVRIHLEKGSMEGHLYYYYMPIMNEYSKDKKKRAKEGAKDL